MDIDYIWSGIQFVLIFCGSWGIANLSKRNKSIHELILLIIYTICVGLGGFIVGMRYYT